MNCKLKSLISRTGPDEPLIAGAHVIVTDRITIPASDNSLPLDCCGTGAESRGQHRSDLLVEQKNIEISQVSALGTKNGLLPVAQVLATRSDAGLAGVRRTVGPIAANPYFAGGIGNALGQVFRQNFPTENIAVLGRITLGNNQAQADFGVDQLQLRQQSLTTARGH